MSSKKSLLLLRKWESKLAASLQKRVDRSAAFNFGDKIYVSLCVSGGRRPVVKPKNVRKKVYLEAITNKLEDADWQAMLAVVRNGPRKLVESFRENNNLFSRDSSWVQLDAALARADLPYRVKGTDFESSNTWSAFDTQLCIWKCRVVKPGNPITPPS